MPRDDLRRRVAALPWTQPADDKHDEPVAGEVWRASWGDTHLLVLLTAVSGSTVRGVVVTGDDVGDENAVVVPAELSPLTGVAMIVWSGLTADLPLRVLDRRLGSLSPAFLSDPGASPFPPVTSVLDDRALVRSDLEDRLEALAHAAWQPETESSDLRELTGVPPGTFAKQVGMLPGDAVLVYERVKPLDEALIERTAEVFGVAAERVAAATTPVIPENVLSLFDRPHRIRRVRSRANELGTTEVTVMHQIAGGVLAAAARTTGHAQPDWGALIDDALGD